VSGESAVDAIVIGAGVAGLGAARELERRGLEVMLVDARELPGGVMGTAEVAGYRIECGPNTFQRKLPMERALASFGAARGLVRASPASRARFLVRGGSLVRVPMGPAELVRTPLLSTRAKWRALCEPFVARSAPRDETVAEFVERRLGAELVDALVGPFLTGVYAGDERELGAEAVFPALVEAERTSGSIVFGLARAALRRGERAPSGTYSHERGLGGFAAELAGGLRRAPELGTRVESLRASPGEGVEVELATARGDQRVRAHRALVATPAREAAVLLRGVDAGAAAWLDGVDYAPIATVALGAPAHAGAFAREPEGFGFLVPRGESDALLGCLYPSELFAQRAPQGRRLLHCMLGGVRSPGVLELDDRELARRALGELDRVLGLRTDPELLRVARWPRAVPQPRPGHRRAVRDVRERLRARGPIAIAGSYADGVSVADSFASGVAAAGELAARALG